ncbi:GNAT family N-acetyltransferase [Legionella yabuuchiae]|uniref:GNAT family N-acetyltransferase n=1 Tax=Legionella yabuuchiae TaxID=376727 RepID=UPI00105538A9|nr:GNAT family N-acetyltransferase [Legionella yabuuchiae]
MNNITTARLNLRSWKHSDIEVFYQINQEPKVLEFLPGAMSHDAVKSFMEKQNKQFQERGFMLWAVEIKESSELIGFVGLNFTDHPFPFAPAVEIGWRLGSKYWGKGYATEAAIAALNFGFNQIHLNEIVSFTVPENIRSQRVMKRIGMMRDAKNDFLHPKLAEDHPLSRHVLYRIHKNDFKQENIF